MCCPALLRACGNHSGEAERSSGFDLKLFGFIPESCSGSSRNTVRNHPGIAFILPRIPQEVGLFAKTPPKGGIRSLHQHEIYFGYKVREKSSISID